MKGKVLDFNLASNTGLITADDGNRYSFEGKDWKSTSHPSAGISVDFETNGNNALNIYIVDQSQVTNPTNQVGLDNKYDSIYCSSDDKLFLGLGGGLAHKFGLPSGAVRFAIFISLFFFIGWLYFIGLFLPKVPTKNISRGI